MISVQLNEEQLEEVIEKFSYSANRVQEEMVELYGLHEEIEALEEEKRAIPFYHLKERRRLSEEIRRKLHKVMDGVGHGKLFKCKNTYYHQQDTLTILRSILRHNKQKNSSSVNVCIPYALWKDLYVDVYATAQENNDV